MGRAALEGAPSDESLKLSARQASRLAQLNTARLTFFDLEWLDRTARCFVCDRGGHIHRFLPTEWPAGNKSLDMPRSIARPFTSRTYLSLAIARGIAAANGHADVTGLHVALGLLREGENPAVAALHRGGVSLPRLRRDLEAALPERGRPVFGEVLLPATPGERAIVEIAAAEADSLDAEYIGNEHLLLALLRDVHGPTSDVFSRHGFVYETAVTQLRAVLSGEL